METNKRNSTSCDRKATTNREKISINRQVGVVKIPYRYLQHAPTGTCGDI